MPVSRDFSAIVQYLTNNDVKPKIFFSDITIETMPNGKKAISFQQEAYSDDEKSSFHGEKRFTHYRYDQIDCLKTATKNRNACKEPFKLILPVESANVVNTYGMELDFSPVIALLANDNISLFVIHLYFESLFEKHQQQASSQLQRSWTGFHYLPIFYFSTKESPMDANPETSSRMQFEKYVSRFDVDPNSTLIAPQFAKQHFFLAVICVNLKVAYIFDSCWRYLLDDERRNQIQCVLKHLLDENKHLNQHWREYEIIYMKECSQQPDRTSCGCCVVLFTQELLANKGYDQSSKCKFTKPIVRNVRETIASFLLSSTPNGSNILKALSG